MKEERLQTSEGVHGRIDRLAAGAALLAAGALLWRMASEPFDHGYVRYLGIADSMVRNGDWVTPRLLGEPYLVKPPLFLWIVAIPIALLRTTPSWAGHFPNLVALALLLLFGARLATRIFERREAGWLAALVLATTFEFFQFLRDKRLDPLFAAFLLGAFAFQWDAFRASSGRARWVATLAAWGCVALATLVKGPLALVFFLGSVALFAVWTRRLREWLGRETACGLLLCLAACAIWPLLLLRDVGIDELRRSFAGHKLISRFGGPLHYLRDLPVQGLPWSLLFPALALHLVRERPDRESQGLRYLLSSFAICFGLLHLSSAKHSRYLLPAFGPLSLLLLALVWGARGEAPRLGPWSVRLRDGALRLGSRALAALLLVAPFALAGMAVASSLGLGRARHFVVDARLLPVGALALACAAGTWAARRRLGDPEPRVRFAAFGLLALGALALFDGLRACELGREDRRPALEARLAPVAAGEPAALLGLREAPQLLVPLLVRRDLPRFQAPPELLAAAAREGWRELWVVTDRRGEEALAGAAGVELEPASRLEIARAKLRLLRLRIGPGAAGGDGPSAP
jgi:4-amino-4-deoxy-L-arabinose transferase-like glycosyltransferase